ncbi:MAG: TadE/TadG family type IV pilus assembly protein, partial [Anaerolineae bacterium]
MVEFAFMLPVFLTILFVLIEGAFVIQGYLTVQHAAREAARWAVIYRPIPGEQLSVVEEATGRIVINPCTGLSSYGSLPDNFIGIDAGYNCYMDEDDSENYARRVALVKEVALQRAAGLRIDHDALGLRTDEFGANQDTPGFFGVNVWGETWTDDRLADHPGLPGLDVYVEVVHNVELVDPFLRIIAPNGVQVRGSANMVNEGVLVAPSDPDDGGDDGGGTPPGPPPTPEHPTPVPPPTPTLPPVADYCLDISFEYVTNMLPLERGHNVDVLVSDCSTGDPYPDMVVSFSTSEGAYDYSGVEDPGNQYAEAMAGITGVARQTVYANESVTATLRTWVDLDGDDTWDAGERFDVATKAWFLQEGAPTLLVSSYEVLPLEQITVDMYDHPEGEAPFTLVWCRTAITGGAGIEFNVLANGIDVDADGNALDLEVEIPADSAGYYQMETHRGSPTDCGDASLIATSAEIRIRPLPPDLHIASISYPETYGDVLPANEYVPFRIEVENSSLWDIEDILFDVDLYVDPPVTPTLMQIGDGKQWLSSIEASGTEVLTIELRMGAGIHELWVQVDTTDYVKETDEGNNILGPYEIEVNCTVDSTPYGDDFDDGSFDGKWSTAEIGSNVGGSVTENGDGYLQIHGRGSSIWGSSDNFFYVYQSISGDFDVRMRVISPPPRGGAKLGVMVRSSTAANSRHVMLAARDADGRRLQFAYRAEDGSSTDYAGSELDPAPSPPVWLRIVRQGANFSYHYSYAEDPTSSDWTLHDTGAEVSMGDTVLVGMAHAKYSSSGSTV